MNYESSCVIIKGLIFKTFPKRMINLLKDIYDEELLLSLNMIFLLYIVLNYLYNAF